MLVKIVNVEHSVQLTSKAGKPYNATIINSIKIDDGIEKRTLLLDSVLNKDPQLKAKVAELTAGSTVNLKFVKDGQFFKMVDVLAPGEISTVVTASAAPSSAPSTGKGTFKLTEENVRYMSMHLSILEKAHGQTVDVARAKEIATMIKEGIGELPAVEPAQTATTVVASPAASVDIANNILDNDDDGPF